MLRQRLLLLALIGTLANFTACGSVENGATGFETGSQDDVDVEVEELVAPGTASADGASASVELVDARNLGADEAVERVYVPAPDHESEETMSASFAQTAQFDAASEAEFLRLLNDERRNAGLGALKLYWDLQDDARSHSKKMDDENDLHHNPSLRGVTNGNYWRLLGENVGRGGSPSSLHRAFMNSPGHRDNILGDYTHVGIGVINDGGLWVTVVFMKAAVAGLENTYPPFTDDDFNPHEAAIHKIWKAGVTFGCGGQNYCPDRQVTRGEMAAFLTRSLGLAPANADHFDDDRGRFYEASANAMFESGVTYGCGERRYCGEDAVTRGQMAAFLDRAFQFPASGRDYFTDDDGRFYESAANDLRLAGITNGCGGANFCGELPLPRDQMAAFLARALNL